MSSQIDTWDDNKFSAAYEKVLIACEGELAWSSRTKKTFRYHIIKPAVKEAIIAELEDLALSFVDNKNYKGYMVKQIISAREEIK